MNLSKVLLIVLVAVVGAVLIVGGCIYRGYDQAITLDEEVKGKWAQVENQLQRRYDLIPNAVETVKGIAGHEKEVFVKIAEARTAYFQAKGPAQKAKAAGVFESALSRLLVLRETYPELKSNQAFLKLQDTVEGTENRLSVERGRYNESVKRLNTFSRRLLGQFYATLAGVEQAEYFEVAEEAAAVPKVDFNSGSDG